MKFSLLFLAFWALLVHRSWTQKNTPSGDFLASSVQKISSERAEYQNFVNAVLKIVVATQPQLISLISVSYPKNNAEKGTHFMVERLLEQLPLNVKYRVQHFDNLIYAEHYAFRPRFYNVIFLNSYEEFTENLLPYFHKFVFDHRGYYILVLTNRQRWVLDDIKNLMKNFWNLYIVNLNILIQDVEGAVLSMTYFPYGPGYCEEVRPVVYNKYENDSFSSRIHFPWKLSDFFGCPLTIAITEAPPFASYVNESYVTGIEGNVVNILAERDILNFSLKIICGNEIERQGMIYPNGTITGALALLNSRRANFTIGFFDIRAERIDLFDHTTSFYSSKMQFLATVEARLSPLGWIWVAFEVEVWIVIFLSLLIGFIVICSLKWRPRYQRDFIVGRNATTPMLNMITIICGNPLHRIPGRNFARTILIYFILFTFVLRTAYQGALYEVAQRDPDYVDSLSEMLEQNFTFYSAPLFKIYIDAVPGLNKSVNYIIPNEDTYMRKVNGTLIPGTKESALSSQYHIHYMNRKGMRKKFLRPVKPELALVSLAIFLPKQSLLTRVFSSYVSRMSASGLVQMSINKFYDRDYLAHVRESYEPVQVTLNDVLGIFQLLLAGLIVATGVFIGELLYYYKFSK